MARRWASGEWSEVIWKSENKKDDKKKIVNRLEKSL
jgi:hypothetical protein